VALRRRPAGPARGSVEAELRALGYELLEQVGRGSHAVVWRARQPRFDRDVAVKVLDVEVTDAAAARRFARECAVMGRLTGHPHVVTVLDAGVTPSGRAHLVMDFFSGGSLGGRLAARGPLAAAEVLRHGSEAADGLQAAHEAGVLHRDLKPENVLLSRFGGAALADFGISLALEHRASLAATQTALTLTPLHASPEVLDGARGDVSSDVYSLCSTLWTLLSGQPPYPVRPGEGVLQFVYRVMAGDLSPLGRPDAPAGLEELLRAGLAASPAARPPSAAVLRDELARLGGRGAGVAPGSASAQPGAAGVAPGGLFDVGLGDVGATRTNPLLQPAPTAGVAAAARRPPWLLPLLTGAGALLVGALVALVVVSLRDGRPQRQGGAPTATAAARSGPPPVLATPGDAGGLAVVSWSPGTVGASTVVQVFPDDGSSPSPVAVPPGATSVAVPVAPLPVRYCFRVVEAAGPPGGGDLAVGVGAACIRGGSFAPTSAPAPPARPAPTP